MSYQSPDGYARSLQAEHDLNHAVARLFSTDEGRIVLDYLKSITTNRACGPDVSDNQLRHLEGQRHLVSILTRRKAYGEEDLPNVQTQPPEAGSKPVSRRNPGRR